MWLLFCCCISESFFFFKSETRLTQEESIFVVTGAMKTVFRYHINNNSATDCKEYSRMKVGVFDRFAENKHRSYLQNLHQQLSQFRYQLSNAKIDTEYLEIDSETIGLLIYIVSSVPLCNYRMHQAVIFFFLPICTIHLTKIAACQIASVYVNFQGFHCPESKMRSCILTD